MTFRRRSAAATLVLTVLGAWLAWAQAPPGQPRLVPQPPARAAAPSAAAIATVGGRAITRDEFRARETQAMSEYRDRIGSKVPAEVRPVVRRQLLENLIRRELLALEAARRGIVPSDAEAEAQLRREPFFNPDGKFDPARFEAVRTGQAESYRRAIGQMKQQLGAQQLNDRLVAEMSPPEPSLRAEARRALTRASLEFAALRRSEFDGSFREPRESEILAAYRAGGDRYRRPAQATLTVLMVDQPPLDESESTDGPAGQSWRARMRARADSALAAARGGASFEDLAQVSGSIRRDVVVTADNFPGYWGGGPRDNAAVFAARPGALLPSPVAASRGWMVVRVEAAKPARLAPLAEVAREIRGALRKESRQNGEDRVLRRLYEQKRATFTTTAWKIRYAVFDTAAVPVGEPTNAELDRWYRAHQADFSSFDAQSGSIRVYPLAEVREPARTRWRSEQRRTAVRLAATQLTAAWQKGARDRALERSAVVVREAGPLVPGASIDTGRVGSALDEALRKKPWSLRVDNDASWTRGAIVYHIYESTPGYQPSFEQVRAQLADQRNEGLRVAEEAGGRALYDRDPSQFAARNVIHYSRLIIERPNPVQVALTRAQVERYYREHLDRYSAGEVVRVRQIMIVPGGSGPDADAAARTKAQGLLARARSGENFEDLARRHSDDAATRDKGGDLGEFGRGTMVAAFENVAFRLPPGSLSDVFKTELGYHIVQGVSYEPLYTQELRYIYANVGWDAALEMSDSLAIRRCDSLLAAVRTSSAARAAAARLSLQPDHTFHPIGDRRGTPEFVSFLIRLENTRPGQMVPARGFDRSAGHFVAWVDSIAPAKQREWEQARPAALESFRRGGTQRAFDAKRAELDSLLAAGWSRDSVVTLLGGWQRVSEAVAGAGLTELGGSETIDSLVFGTPRRGPALEEGQTAGWLDLPGGIAILKVIQRTPPEAARVNARAENEGRNQFEQRLAGYFEDLKKRYPIRIHDERLRDTPLPPPPSSRPR
ncbi:MAG: peptidyl-prolyl cis-trans isomerase [Candidatus Eisenbacteria bacterium]